MFVDIKRGEDIKRLLFYNDQAVHIATGPPEFLLVLPMATLLRDDDRRWSADHLRVRLLVAEMTGTWPMAPHVSGKKKNIGANFQMGIILEKLETASLHREKKNMALNIAPSLLIYFILLATSKNNTV